MFETVLQNIFVLSAIILAAAVARRVKIGKYPPIVSELIAGVILGTLALSWPAILEPVRHGGFVSTLSEIAISYLLFRIGFSATLGEMRKIGMRALYVALAGVFATAILGIFLIPYFIGGVPNVVYLFLAAALTSTSVGMTARVLKDMNRLDSPGSRIILVAAVIDDVAALFLLAMTMAQYHSGSGGISGFDIGILQISIFIIAAIVLGKLAAKILPKVFYGLYPHSNAKIVGVALFFILFYAASKWVGLTPIVGAFIAGLVLERDDFDDPKNDIFHGERVEGFLENTSAFLAPIFFVSTGMLANVTDFLSLGTVFAALGLLLVAVAGKLFCALTAGKGNEPWLVGFGMIPRGEIALFFGAAGFEAGLFGQQVFSAVLIVVLATIFITPPAILSAAKLYPVPKKTSE